jgi:cytochrome oxidase assembly protein ShyY1
MIKLKSILFWVLFLAVQGVLLSLSQWQWDRLDQKEKAIELRDKRWSSEAIPVEQAIVQGGMTPEWSHVMVCGQVKPKLYAKVSYLAGLPKAAFSLAVPMLADLGSLGNRNIILDVGYFYFDQETNFESPLSTEKKCFSGHIMPIPPRPRWNVGGSAVKDTYSYFDVDMMASRWSLKPYVPLVVRLDQVLPLYQGQIMPYDSTPPEINNPHRGYALTWLALAVLWPVIMGLRFWRR